MNVKELAKAEITQAQIKTYGGVCTNISEGDYGTWDDWKNLLIRFGEKIIDNYEINQER